MQYMGNSGNIYNVVDKRIAHGGEGDIKEIIGMPSQVAKIFKEKFRTAERQEKLSVMIKKKLSPEQLEMIAWPQDVIYDSTGFVGYIMPKIENKKSLTILYSEKKYDLQDRLLAATNLCAAIDMVHEMGSICGDLNPLNHVNRNTDCSRLVCNGSCYGLANPPCSICAELISFFIIKFFNCLYKT